jgi:hypothetical protein
LQNEAPNVREGVVVRTLIHRLASIKIGVALLAVIIVALAAGTILESAKGRDHAMQQVYSAWWPPGASSRSLGVNVSVGQLRLDEILMT